MRPVIIIGGGISGLATAWYLSQAGIPATIVEREARLGGLLVTDSLEGCVVEGGPDSYLTTKTAATTLIEEAGLGEELIGSNDHRRATYIWRDGALRRIPEGFTLMVPTRLGPLLRSNLLSPLGRLRALRDVFRRPRISSPERSVAEFVEDHFGSEVLDYIAEPLLTGVYGGDPAKMSAPSVLPKLVDWERRYGSLTRAARQESGQVSGPLFSSLRRGMGSLVDRLLERAKPEVITGTVERIEQGYRLRVNGDWIDSNQLVVACRTDEVLPGLFPAVPYTSSTVIAVGYRRVDVTHPLHGFGFLVPKRERKTLAACTWVNTKFDHRAAPGLVLFRCFFIGNSPGDWRQELREKMGITAEPVFTREYRWPQSMPQYELGHGERTGLVESMVADLPGLHLTGNAYRGVGIPDCIRMAKEVAQRVRNLSVTQAVPDLR